MCSPLESFALVPAHIGHVLDAGPMLRSLHPKGIDCALEDLERSHAWTLLIGGDVLCIAGITRAGSPWVVLMPLLLRHRTAFSVGACAMVTALREVRPELGDDRCSRDPDAAREWLFEVSRRQVWA
jgi:hypothetical protein